MSVFGSNVRKLFRFLPFFSLARNRTIRLLFQQNLLIDAVCSFETLCLVLDEMDCSLFQARSNGIGESDDRNPGLSHKPNRKSECETMIGAWLSKKTFLKSGMGGRYVVLRTRSTYFPDGTRLRMSQYMSHDRNHDDRDFKNHWGRLELEINLCFDPID